MRTNLSFKAVFAFFFLLVVASASWAQVTISGRVTAVQTLAPMEGVAVMLSGTTNDLALTDDDGRYEFTVPAGGTYSVQPFANASPLNGVSTYDMVLIAKHVNGEELLNSPYKIIAADVDYSEVLDSTDWEIGYNLILGIITSFPNDESWRFVSKDYVFPDPQNPFPFPNNLSFTNLSTDVENVDFLGIKIGDVNNTAIPEGGFVASDYYPSRIIGSVVFDQNENCLNDAGEPVLDDWIVAAQNSDGQVYFSSAQSTGAYSIPVPDGVFDVTVFPPNPLWEACAQVVEDVSVGVFDTVTIDFSVQTVVECPLLEVDLSTPFLRRCFDNTYTVFYCNKGTALAEDAYIEVEFDPFLTVESSTLQWSSVSGNTYTFQVGDMEIGQCGSFNVKVNVSCDAELGQTHCSEARIYPDTLCIETNPAWSGASLVVEAECAGDEVIFTITNMGEAMTEPVNYIVIEDIMVQMTGGSILLGSGESQTITIPANGSTWRLELDQALYHPLNTFVSAAIEGCGENGSGSFSLGFVTLFPENEWGGHVDEDCQENIGAYDPNDKQGFPSGVFNEHFIPKGTEIEYLIRFQNTGTDTAFTVMILDTLSPHLDIATIRPGGSSHPYDFNMVGPGVAQFLFANILLPDSNVNEPASNGYVKFSIRPKADLPNMTAIENQAAIFFDFNAPVITNRTLHTLGEQFLDVSTVVFRPGLELEVYPNPASVRATFFIKSATPTTGNLQIFDLQGRLMLTQLFNTNTFELNAGGLAPGLYLFRLESEGHPIAAGKIIVQRHE